MTRLALARQGGPGFFAFPYISQIIYLPGHAFENANVAPLIGAKTTHEFVSGTFFLSRRVVNRLLQLLQHITCQGAARPAKMREEDKRLNKAGDARWPPEPAVNPCDRREGRSATDESGDESPHSKTAAIAFV